MPDGIFYEDLHGVISDSKVNQGEIFLAAPYIKLEALKKVIGETKARIVIVTRWSLEDFIANVSDISIYPLVESLAGKIYSLPRLHAKYYRFNTTILMGSANLTNAALFAGESGNLELISTISNAFDYRKFEDFVVNQSTQVTSDIYLKYHDLLKNWEFEENSSNEMEFWPNELNPETIFSKFKLGESQAEVTKLKIPKNVSKWEVFLGFLQVRMMEFENIRSVMKFIDASGQYGRRFGEVRSFIKQNYGVQDETYVWKCLMIWLVELYPHRYTYDRPNHTEIIRSVSHSYS